MSLKENRGDISHLSEEEVKNLHDLFESLDVNKDGTIDIHDLTRAMESMKVPHIPGHAQKLLKKYDTDKDDQISFAEFVKYVQDHEKVLRLFFKKIDTNDDGSIDTHEIMESFHRLGVNIDKAEADKLLQRMDKDGTLKIDWNEWRNYLILSPSTNLSDILHYWRHASVGPAPSSTSSSCYIHDLSPVFPTHICQYCLAQVRRVLHEVRVGSICVTQLAPVQTVPHPVHADGEWGFDSHPNPFDSTHPHEFLHPVIPHLLQNSEVKRGGSSFVVGHSSAHSVPIIDIGENSLVPDDFTEVELKTGMWWRHLVAGGVAGCVSRTCTAPLDRLKVLLQVYGSKKHRLTISKGFRQMLEEGGIKGLWRGNGMNVVKIAPESAIKFMAYEQIKSRLKKDPNSELTMGQRFLSGSAAGAIAQTCIYPMEVMKTRLALRRTGQYSSMADCARTIFRNEGLRVFYRGYVPNLLGIIPYAGIDLAIYETLKNSYTTRNKGRDPGALVMLGCGTVSSTCGQLASYPLALVRTRLQAKGSTKDTMVGLFAKILREDGPRGLYRGIVTNFMKVIPAVSTSYVVYEQVRVKLGVTMS